MNRPSSLQHHGARRRGGVQDEHAGKEQRDAEEVAFEAKRVQIGGQHQKFAVLRFMVRCLRGFSPCPLSRLPRPACSLPFLHSFSFDRLKEIRRGTGSRRSTSPIRVLMRLLFASGGYEGRAPAITLQPENPDSLLGWQAGG